VLWLHLLAASQNITAGVTTQAVCIFLTLTGGATKDTTGKNKISF
jgi:hypothetical protein